MTRSRTWQWLLIGTIAISGGCGLTNDSTDEVPSANRPAETAPEGKTPHLDPGSIRCARCHSDDNRRDAHWKEIAKKVGHDIDASLAERTTCTCCHMGEVKGFGEPIDRQCVQCHDDIRVTITGMGQMHCLSCHDPSSVGGALIRESAWECQKCHGQTRGNHQAIDVHGAEDCTNCHRPHEEPWTLPRTCTDCHITNDTHHGEKEGASPCDVCHRPHEVAGDAAMRCQQCHDKQKPGTFSRAVFDKGHACQSCHDAHAAPNAPPRTCTSCHANVHTMSGRGQDKHGQCSSCHDAHDVRKNPAASCGTCHNTISPRHPDPQGHGCTACHDPHPDHEPAPATRACTDCHDKAKNENAFHASKTACRDCHAPHAFDKASVIPCKQCHAQETVAATNGHRHGECSKCHDAHAPKEKLPACASCHAQEHLTASEGHLNCLQCHDNHPQSRAPKKQCPDCHQKQTHGPHEQKECTSCHRAHGPDAPMGPNGPGRTPTCLSCHPIKQLASLHVLPQHQECSLCHTAHKTPRSDRPTCLTNCHVDKRNHEPTARTCEGCHAFRPLR